MRGYITALLMVASLNWVQTARASDGSSGCGPGWYVFKDTSLVSSALRTVTNTVLFPSSTLGMTFGTSNCSKHNIVEKERAALEFVAMTGRSLMVDMATGGGEYLDGLAVALGCPGLQQEHFNHVIKSNFDKILPRPDLTPEELLTNVVAKIGADERLAVACLSLIG